MNYVIGVCHKCNRLSVAWHPHVGQCCQEHLTEALNRVAKQPSWASLNINNYVSRT